MRKLSILLCLFLLAGCSGKQDNGGVPKIEEHVWQMTTIQSTDENGQAVAFGPEGSSTLENAVEMQMECSAESGSLILTDQTNGVTYSGTYQLDESDRQTSRYEVVIEDTKGWAVSAMTTYHDESQRSTLIISLDDYTLNFFPAAE